MFRNTPTVVQPSSNTPYIRAVSLMATLGVVGAVLIIISRTGLSVTEILLIVAAVFGFLSPITLSLLSFMKSQETHLAVNSRLDAFMSNGQEMAYAKGFEAGRNAADTRTDALALAAPKPPC